jgi:hypothetical protein
MGRRRTLILVTLAIAVCWASRAPAQPRPTSVPAPKTRPAATTRPATGPAAATEPAVDLSTPKAALRALSAALHDGDAGRLREVLATTNPAEERMIGAIAQTAAAFNRLHAAAAQAFGDAAAARFTGETEEQYAQSLGRIDAAEVAIDGDKASVRYPGAVEPEYELRRTDGRWRVPMAQFSRGADAATLDARVAEASGQVRIVLELAGEIGAGKYRTAEAASEAWRGKISQALGRPPGTQASTKPER